MFKAKHSSLYLILFFLESCSVSLQDLIDVSLSGPHSILIKTSVTLPG